MSRFETPLAGLLSANGVGEEPFVLSPSKDERSMPRFETGLPPLLSANGPARKSRSS